MATAARIGIGTAEGFAKAGAPTSPQFFRSLLDPNVKSAPAPPASASPQQGRKKNSTAAATAAAAAAAGATEWLNMCFKIAPVPGNGMGLVATKAIPRGSTILRETAVLKSQGATHPSVRGAVLDFFGVLNQFLDLDEHVASAIMDMHLAPKPHLIAAMRPAIVASCRKGDGSPIADADVDRLVDMIGKFQTNAFVLDKVPGGGGADALPDNVEVTGLFLMSSRLNHSCIPNAERHTRAVPPTIKIVATKDIAAGEEITISYMTVAGQTVAQRRETTRRIWDFTCKCPACESGDKVLENETAQSVAKVREMLRGLGVDIGDESVHQLPGGLALMTPSFGKQ